MASGTVVAGIAGCSSGSGGSSDGNGNGDHHDGDDGHHDGEGNGNGDHHDGNGENSSDSGDHHDGNGENSSDSGDHHDGDGNGDHHDGNGNGDGHDHDTELPKEPSASAEVVMKTEDGGQHFVPHLVWIEPGGTVTWKLESGSHNTVAYHPDNDKPLRMPEDAQPWSSELLSESGTTASHTYETPGVYDYFCQPHEGAGMVGTVVVGKPDPHEQPALEKPQSSLPDSAQTQLTKLTEQAKKVLDHDH